jgi:hypothetical protein
MQQTMPKFRVQLIFFKEFTCLFGSNINLLLICLFRVFEVGINELIIREALPYRASANCGRVHRRHGDAHEKSKLYYALVRLKSGIPNRFWSRFPPNRILTMSVKQYLECVEKCTFGLR